MAEAEEFPALSSAARSCDVDTLRRLLSEGVNVDHTMSYYNCRATPLQLACSGGMINGNPVVSIEDRVACVKLLIEHGALVDAGAPGNPGESTARGTNVTPLMHAAYGGHLDIVKILLSAGADVNVLCNSFSGLRYSTLIMAMISYQASGRRDPKECDAIVETLVRAGVDVNPPEMAGLVAMDMAIAHGRRRIWPLLLRAGAILGPVDKSVTPQNYDTHRTHPYLLKIDAAVGFKAYEKAHRTKLLATFTPKFTHLVPPELVPIIVEFSFHVGFY